MTQTPLKSDYDVRRHVPLKDFIVQAHRGWGELSEENTLEAFELAWTRRCVPEADVRTTADGVIVPFHDADFSRVVKNAPPELAKRGVKDVTFAQLQALDVGSWRGEQFSGRRVSRLTDVLAAMTGRPERLLYVDAKNVDLRQLANEVRAAKVQTQAILTSTQYALPREWKAMIPDSPTLLWMGGTEAELNRRFEELRANHFAGVTQLQIHTHLKGDAECAMRESANPFEESDAFLIEKGKEVRAHGILFQTLPYGGTMKEIYWKLMDMGFMSFATDYPDVTWDAVKMYYSEGT